jgi:carboxyl-terminal processing protease
MLLFPKWHSIQEITVKTDRSIFLALLVVVVASLSGGLWGGRLQATPRSTEDVDTLLKTYAQVLSLAEENYADRVDTEKTLYDSIRGMLQTLDPHSSFFDSKTYRQFRDDQRGKFFGVGISLAIINGHPTVVATQPGTPAHRLGVRSGDIVVKINGKPSIGLSREQVAETLRGPRGTLVKVSMQREGLQDLLEFSIVRDVIPQYSVPFAFYFRDKIGYIRIESFTETTQREVEESLRKLGPELQGLVLDLRNNPGGSLQAAIGVADQFLKRGQEVVVTKGRLLSANQHYVVPKGAAGNYAMVVLINSDSASASEIVAGAVQDHDRGLILGETSFGKGLVQSVFDLSRGAGVALVTAKWYTPSGRLIQRDYTKKSFYDYFNGKGRETKTSEVRRTDSGREVYGGGGIRPDVTMSAPPLNPFQSVLLSNASFFSFIRSYSARHPEPRDGSPASSALADEFKSYLHTREIPFQDEEFAHNLEFVKRQLRYEYTLARVGFEEAQKVVLEGDAQVLKALELLPQAGALFANAEKLMASKKIRVRAN